MSEDALLHAICEHPDDDTPRLVFADWLDERGDELSTAWAALIRDQLRSHGAANQTVYFEYDKGWLRNWGQQFEFPATWRFECWNRGFPTQLDAPADAIRAEWERVLRLVPVREVYARGATDADVEGLVAWCDFRNLSELFVQSEVPRDAESLLTDRALVALAECPAVTGLECLVVRWGAVTDRGIDALLCSHSLGRLHEFQVYRDRNFAASPGACERLRARFGSNAIR